MLMYISWKLLLCINFLVWGNIFSLTNAITYEKAANRFNAINGQGSQIALHKLKESLKLAEEDDVPIMSFSAPVKGKFLSRHEETHNGIRVLNSRITVCSDENAFITDIDGVIALGLEREEKISKAAIDQAKQKQSHLLDLAKKATKERLKTENMVFESIEHEILIELFEDSEGTKSRLLYEIGLYSSEGNVVAQKILMSVEDESIIGMFDDLQTYAKGDPVKISSLGGNPRHFYTYDNAEYEQINASYVGRTENYTHACELDFTDYAIVHCQNKDSYSSVFGTPFIFDCDPMRSKHVRLARSDCSSLFRDDSNEACSPLADIAYFTPKALQMYREYLNSPFNNPLGHKINICVHYKQNYFNAFFSTKTKGLYFGDGSFHVYPLSSSAVVLGHELGHLRSNLVANLMYANETGGLSESISDVTGLAFDYFINEGRNKTTLNWIVGDDITKLGNGFRDLCNPDISTVAEYFALMPMLGSNNKSPHMVCGIFNKLACELVHQHQESYNLRKVFVLFDTGLYFWKSKMSFDEIACGFLEAAQYLEYELSPLVIELRNRGIATDQCFIQ